MNIKTKKTARKYTAFNGEINSHLALRFGIADASYETGNSKYSLYLTAQSFVFLNNKSKVQESTATESSVRNLAYRRNFHYNDTYVALGEATVSGVMPIILRSALPSIIFFSRVRPMEKTC